MSLQQTTLNPASGGANIVTDGQSSGAQMPVSELAFSADGVADAKLVTPANPLPVGGQGQSTGLPAAIVVDQSAGANRVLVHDDELLSAVQETNRLLRAVVRGLSMQLDGYDLLQEEL